MFAGVRREEDGESLQQAGADHIELLMLDVTDSKQIAAVTQALLPLVRAARGRVVFVGSVNGRLSLPFLSPYAASKYAIEAIGDSLRGEMRPFGVKVSIVEPGAIETPMREKGSAAAHQAKDEPTADQLRIYGKALDGFMAGAAKADEDTPTGEGGGCYRARLERRSASNPLPGRPRHSRP